MDHIMFTFTLSLAQQIIIELHVHSCPGNLKEGVNVAGGGQYERIYQESNMLISLSEKYELETCRGNICL